MELIWKQIWKQNFSLLALVLTLLSMPLSATRWSTPKTVDTDGYMPAFAMNKQGQGIIFWSTSANGMQAARVDQSGISRTSQVAATMGASYGSVAIDPQGTAVAIWIEKAGNSFAVKAARLDALARDWTSFKEPLATFGVCQRCVPQIGSDAAGNMVAVWGNSAHLVAAKLAKGSDSWVKTSTIKPHSSIAYPQLAVAGNGNAIVVWTDSNSGSMANSAILEAGSLSWNTMPLPGATGGIFPQVAIDARGNAVAIWQTAGVGAQSLKGAFLSRGADKWQGTTNLGMATNAEGTTALRFDNEGTAYALWLSYVGPFSGSLQAATLAQGSRIWSLPMTLLAGNNEVVSVDLISDSANNVVAVWSNSGLGLLQSATKMKGAKWSVIDPIASGGRKGALIAPLGITSSGIVHLIYQTSHGIMRVEQKADRRTHKSKM